MFIENYGAKILKVCETLLGSVLIFLHLLDKGLKTDQ